MITSAISVIMKAQAMNAVEKTEIPGVPAPRRGKVRDVYDLGDKLLIVATDRVSAFDVILPDAIPEKGKILTQISLFWFRQMADIIENHVISAEVSDFPPPFDSYGELLAGRSILAKKADVFPVECIVRGYLSGSGWKSYRETGSVCGIELPAGLRESSRLPRPIFTPSTKAAEGHDENISFDQCVETAGRREAGMLRDYSIKIYERARDIALKKGIIIADTKMEFGMLDGRMMLIDELLTPDSSRFWSVEGYREGAGQDSFDKQIIRDALIAMGWDMRPPAPKLREEVLSKATARYKEILNILTS